MWSLISCSLNLTNFSNTNNKDGKNPKSFFLCGPIYQTGFRSYLSHDFYDILKYLENMLSFTLTSAGYLLCNPCPKSVRQSAHLILLSGLLWPPYHLVSDCPCSLLSGATTARCPLQPGPSLGSCYPLSFHLHHGGFSVGLGNHGESPPSTFSSQTLGYSPFAFPYLLWEQFVKYLK